MRARALIAALCGANIVIGFLLGVAADRSLFAAAPAAQSSSDDAQDDAEDTSSDDAPEVSGTAPVATSALPPRADTAPVDSRARRRGRRGGRDRSARMVSHLTTELALTPEQVKAVQTSLLETRKRMHAVFQPLREKMRALHQQSEEEIRAILTPAQLERFEALKREHRRHGPPWARGGDKRGGRSWGRGRRGPQDEAGKREERRGRWDGRFGERPERRPGFGRQGERGPRGERRPSFGERRGPQGPQDPARPEGPERRGEEGPAPDAERPAPEQPAPEQPPAPPTND